MKRPLARNRPFFGRIEALAWVAGLAAFMGLVIEVIRLLNRDPAASLIGVVLVLYVMYAALSVRFLWNLPGIAVPVSLFVGGALWTLALRSLERADLPRVLIATIFIPLAMMLVAKWVDPNRAVEDEAVEPSEGPGLVHALLAKGAKLGTLTDPWADSYGLCEPEIQWTGPLVESPDAGRRIANSLACPDSTGKRGQAPAEYSRSLSPFPSPRELCNPPADAG